METETFLRQRLRLARNDGDALRQLVALLSARGDFSQAAKIFTQLCELTPEAPQLWLELATLWLRAGASKQAVAAAQTGLNHGADAYEAQCLLAEAHERAGNVERAIAAYRAGLLLRPTAWALHNNLGLLLRQRGDFPSALEQFERTAALAPSHVASVNNRGNVLRAMGQLEEALQAYDQALTLDPNHLESHFNRGLVLLQLNRSEQAMAEFSSVLAVAPANRAAELQLIEALISGGQFEAANRHADELLALAPDCARAWYLKASLMPEHADLQPLINLLGKLRRERRHHAEDLGHLDFALGKLLDESGAYDAAFSHFRLANKQQRDAHPKARRQSTLKLGEAVLGLPLANWDERGTEFSRDDFSPIFIVGMPRSGTTLVEQILSVHPAVFAAGEVDYFGPALTWLPAADHQQASLAGKLVGMTELQKATLRTGYWRRLRALGAQGSIRMTDKTPLNFLYLGLLRQLFPQARFIHCQRHPLDTCLSIYFQQFGSLDWACDLEEIAQLYLNYQALMQHWQVGLNLQICEVRYESLVADPETSVRLLLENLGLPWHAACLESHTHSRTINSASRWQARQPIYRRAARWQRFEKHLTALKKKLGAFFDA